MKEYKHKIRICLGSACYSKAEHNNLDYIEAFLEKNKLKDEVEFVGHLCEDQCKHGPNLEIDKISYHGITPDKLDQILLKHFPINEK